VFYKEFLLNVKEMRTNIRPAFISDYLTTYGAKGYVNVATAAWNTGWHNGKGFVQWTGSQLQKDALNEVSILSKRFHTLKENVTLHGQLDLSKLLDEAYWHLLRSQTSCNFFWGEAWVYKCRQDVSTAEQILNQVESEMTKITHF
jgi:hypothetical protein